MTPLWLLLVHPPLPHSLNQEMMEELVSNAVDCKGMSSDHSNHDWYYGEIHQMMKEILSKGVKELFEHELLEHRAQSLESQLYIV